VPNKAQFIEALAERFEGDRKRAAAALDAVIDTVYAAVAKGDHVRLTGFGIFEKRERAARKARNPATGAAVHVKKTSVPAFRAGAEFKAITSGAKKLAKVPAQKAVAAVKKAAPAKKASGQEGTGQEGRAGQGGTGQEGTGQEGTGQEGTGQEGTGQEGRALVRATHDGCPRAAPAPVVVFTPYRDASP